MTQLGEIIIYYQCRDNAARLPCSAKIFDMKKLIFRKNQWYTKNKIYLKSLQERWYWFLLAQSNLNVCTGTCKEETHSNESCTNLHNQLQIDASSLNNHSGVIKTETMEWKQLPRATFEENAGQFYSITCCNIHHMQQS